jgi:nucleotide-binding universal stress UspA family protein
MGGEEAEENAAPFSRILVAVDNSERAIRAFDYALRLSKVATTGTVISVVHVVTPPVAGEEGVPAAQLTESLRKEGEQLIAQLKSRAQTQFAVRAGVITIKIDYMMKEGNPAKVILASAKESSADLIVMGSSGTGGVKELLLGSVSHAVSNHATCPVLIVK